MGSVFFNHIVLYISIAAFIFFLFLVFLLIIRQQEKKKYLSLLQKSDEEKKEATKALKLSEGKYFSLIRTINEGFIYTDTKNKILFLNEKACELLGSKFDDIINKNLYDFLHGPEDVIAFQEKSEKKQKSIADKHELRVKKVNGDYVWLSFSVSPIVDENNHCTGSVAIIDDITQRKQYDFSMKELTSNLNQKVKQLNCLYDIYDLTSIPGITFDEVFKRSLEIIPFGLKYSHDTCVEIIFKDVAFRSDNFEETQWCFTVPIKVQKKKLGQLRVCYIEEKPYIKKDPFHFNEKILLKNIAEKLGQVIESKNMERLLKETNHKLAVAQKIAQVGDLEWDLINHRKTFSDSFFDIIEVPSDKRFMFDEDMFLELVHPEDKKHIKKVFDKIMKYDFNMLKFESRFIQSNGNIQNIFFTGDIIYDDNNKPVKLIFTIQNTTGYKEGRK